MQLNSLRNKNNPVVCMRNYSNMSRGGKDPPPPFIPPIIKEATSSCSDLVQDTPQHHLEHFVYERCPQPASEQADLTTRLEQEGFYIFRCHLDARRQADGLQDQLQAGLPRIPANQDRSMLELQLLSQQWVPLGLAGSRTSSSSLLRNKPWVSLWETSCQAVTP